MNAIYFVVHHKMIDSNILSLATFNKVIEEIPKSKFVQCQNVREGEERCVMGGGGDDVFDLHYKMIKNKHNTANVNVSKRNTSNTNNTSNIGNNGNTNNKNTNKNNKIINSINTTGTATNVHTKSTDTIQSSCNIKNGDSNDADFIMNCDYTYLSKKYNKKIVHLKNKEIVYIDVTNIDANEEFIIIDDNNIIHGNDYNLLSLLVEDIHNRTYITLCKLFKFIDKKYNIKEKAGKQKKKELEINIRNFFINYK